MTLHELVLASAWPPRRDKMRYDANWLLYITDLRRAVLYGIPSVFK
jgi:hypothetical protein